MAFPMGISPSSSSSAGASSSLFADTSKNVQFGISSSAAGVIGAVAGVAALAVALFVVFRK